MASDTVPYVLRLGHRDPFLDARAALSDFGASLAKLHLAWALAAHDVAARYRGAVLGPFWITLSMGCTALGVGLVYARLFHVSATDFLPFVALGLILFSFVASAITEGCDAFVQARTILSQTSLPMLVFVWRTLLRGLIHLAHHAAVGLIVLGCTGGLDEARPVAAAVGLALVVLNVSWMGLIAAIVSARFRDVPPILGAVLQLAMLLTPIFWRPERLGDAQAWLAFNPFGHLVEAVRGPLLGVDAAPSCAVLSVMAFGGWILAFAGFATARRRMVHYL